MAKDENRIHCFISHSTQDERSAAIVKRELEKYGFEAFICEQDIDTGCRYIEKIMEEIVRCDLFIILLNPDSYFSQWVNQEIGYAFSIGNKKFIPLLMGQNIIPAGFIRGVQGRRVPTYPERDETGKVIERYQWPLCVRQVIENLIDTPEYREIIRFQIIGQLKELTDFNDSPLLLYLIDEKYTDLSTDEKKLIIEYATGNRVIYHSYGSHKILIKWLRSFKKDVTVEKREKLFKLIKTNLKPELSLPPTFDEFEDES